MLKDALTLSALIAAVLLVRAAFKNRVPKRLIYALWLVVLLKLCLPGTAYALPLLPAEQTAAVQQTEAPAQPAPAAQQPAQAAAQPQTPAQQPASQPQEAAKPAAAMPLVTEPVLVIWFCGSALLGLWLLLTWLVFTVRLRRSRRFLGRRGRVRIYAAGSISSPCLAGLIPAVYLTEDVVQSDAAELILRHELTHLRHLDPLWSFCRAAAVTVYWWNPFVWLAALISGRDAELACDEAVAAKLSPAQRVAYARHSGAGPAQGGRAEPRRPAGQGAHRLPHQKAAHERPLRRSRPAAHRDGHRLLVRGADAAELQQNHAEGHRACAAGSAAAGGAEGRAEGDGDAAHAGTDRRGQ